MEYQSLIVPGLMVDTPNYITEIIIKRRYEKRRKAPPKFAYWRAEYGDDTKEERNEYIAELTQIKKLLNVFSPAVVISYITNTPSIWSYRYLKKEQLNEVITNLFKLQLQYITELRIKKSEIQVVADKQEYIQNKISQKQTNLLTKGL